MSKNLKEDIYDEFPDETPELGADIFLHLSKLVTTFFKLFCWPPLQIFPRLVSTLSFQAPKESSYSFVYYKNDTNLHFRLKDKFRKQLYRQFADGVALNSIHNFHCCCEPFFCETSRGNTIAGLYMKSLWKTELTIIVSHNNCTDMGHVLVLLWRLWIYVGCNVVAYDYSGYGLSTGRSSERNIYADIEAVFFHVCTHFNVRQEMTILFGESIGSVPTVDLASRAKFLSVILESPIYSGLHSMFNSCCDIDNPLVIDPFPNISKVDRIECKVLLMVTTEDALLDMNSANKMYNRFKYKVKPFVVKGGHNTCPYHPKFIKRINRFIDKDIKLKRNLKEYERIVEYNFNY